MWIDALLQLASVQAVTSTAVSANAIDLTRAADLGAGEPLYAVISVDQAAAAAGAATVNFQVISSPNANLSSATVLTQSGAIDKSELTYGRRPIVISIPRHVLTAQLYGQRYLGLQFTVNGGPLTAGQFTVNLVHDVQDLGKLHGSGFSVA